MNDRQDTTQEGSAAMDGFRGTLYEDSTSIAPADDLTPDYTVAEMEALLTTEADRLRDAEGRLAEAQRQFENMTDRHPLARGNEGVLRELRAQHLPALEEAEEEVGKLAEVAQANLRGVFGQTQQAGYDLSPEEYAQAATRSGFIREACERRPYSRLVNDLRFALVKDDRPALYAYAQYLPDRLADSDRGPSGDWQDSAAQREKAELRRMLATVDKRLRDTSLQPVNRRAGELLSRSGQLVRLASKRQQSEQRYVWQSDNDVSWDEG